MLGGERKKETKKIEQKDPMNKNDLANSERIGEMKNLCKSQKIDSELSLNMVKNFCKLLKGKETALHMGQILPNEKLGAKDSEIVKSPTITCKAERVWLGMLSLLYYAILL